MAIQPGSLDYLYYNGILDHIPYEAYSMPVMGQSCGYPSTYNMDYLDSAKSGYGYQYNGTDSFIPQNPIKLNDYSKTPGQEFKEYLTNATNKITALPMTIKGLLAGGVIATTITLLIKGLKRK